MKCILFLLITLLSHNLINGQAKYEIETQRCVSEAKNGDFTTDSILCSIQNIGKYNSLIFFTEENIDSLAHIKLLRRKLFRRYKDFSLSMIEFEPNMTIKNCENVIPELFVKILAPGEKLEIIIPFSNIEEENIASRISKHLLICSESDLSDNIIGMPNYVKNLRKYDFIYPNKRVIISVNKLKSFFRQNK